VLPFANRQPECRSGWGALRARSGSESVDAAEGEGRNVSATLSGTHIRRHAAHLWYSWISPPNRSRLPTGPTVPEGVRELGGDGQASWSPRCGRPAL
jgi:hypothetical protein